jgi:hypothetical protein
MIGEGNLVAARNSSRVLYGKPEKMKLADLGPGLKELLKLI